MGGHRDLHLVRRLLNNQNLARLKAAGRVLTRLGVIPGKTRQKAVPQLRGQRYFEAQQFPKGVICELDASSVPPWDDPRIAERDSTDFEAFKNPQLLIKQSFSATQGRFRAALVTPADPEWGVICKKTYLSVRDLSPDARFIRTAVLVYNSQLATYFLGLTSSRMHYVTEVLSDELVTVPLPDECPDWTTVASFEEIDVLVRSAFSLTTADWTVIEDFLNVALPDSLRKAPGRGREATRRGAGRTKVEPELAAFASTMMRVLKETFGREKLVSATIYQEPAGTTLLPVRMLTIHLDVTRHSGVRVEPIEVDGLFDMLSAFHHDVLSKKARSATNNGLGFQRVAFFFHADETAQGRVQNFTIVKPDEYRYWTRSQAMRDADELATAIVGAAREAGRG
jgi:hypothetical protein